MLITTRTVDDEVAPRLLTFKVPGKHAAKKAAGSAVGKKANVPSQNKIVREDVDVASILEKSPVKVGPANSRTQELSYDMSPYQSDDDDEEEDDQPTKKFIPSWCSKSRVAMVLPLQQQIDPVKLFPLQSFCNMDEVMLPIRLQTH
ncbi:putative inner centromere protein, ARK-binding domain-containing protein [Tanacetum coccineum]